MQNLNGLIDPALKLTLTGATAVNNSSQIVAESANDQAYLLTPVPEPGSLWMLLAGVALVYSAVNRTSNGIART